MTAPPAARLVPAPLRIGVTGHRQLPEDPALKLQVHCALERLRQLVRSSKRTPVELAVVSPLAEGADRLVANAALQMGTTALEVPLPLAEDDYLSDFGTEESRCEFKELLAQASKIVLLPAAATREEAYEQAGRYVVKHADVLIALWDGEPAHGLGGTAEIVALARRRCLPLLWIATAPPFELREERLEDVRTRRGAG